MTSQTEVQSNPPYQKGGVDRHAIGWRSLQGSNQAARIGGGDHPVNKKEKPKGLAGGPTIPGDQLSDLSECDDKEGETPPDPLSDPRAWFKLRAWTEGLERGRFFFSLFP